MSQPGTGRLRRVSSGRRRLVVSAVVAAFVATACGSSLSRQELMAANLGAFRAAFGAVPGAANYRGYLDFDGLGAINGLDLGQFRSRFGVVLP